VVARGAGASDDAGLNTRLFGGCDGAKADTDAEADSAAAVVGQEVGVVVAVSVVALVVAVAALVDEDDDGDVEEPGLESLFMARLRRVG
jgi:hypothetical protein